MASTRSTRKRQTQLGFTPLPTSSPAKKGQPEAIRDRAAAVTITDTPSPANKRRTLRDYLPTPSASSQTLQEPKPVDSPSSTRVTRSFIASHNKSENPKPNTKRRAELDYFDDSESDTAAFLSPPTKKVRQSKVTQVPEDAEVEVLSSSEEDMPRSSARRKTAILSDSDDADAANLQTSHRRDRMDDNDDDVEIDEEEEDEIPLRRKRRSLKISPRTPQKPKNEQDKADLDEDLEFLGEADTETPRGTRKRDSVAKTAKQLALEKLKKARLKRTNRPDDGDDKNEDEDENESNDSSGLDPNVAEEDESDFIVEDDNEDAIGAPVELPFQFSKYRSMKAKELFIFVVEWMVMRKINPAFDTREDKYQIAFSRLDDFVRGMSGSKFTSSAWTPIFSRMLKTRPILKERHFAADSMFNDRCDACNRSGHPATWEVKFKGKKYHKNTLEEESDEEMTDEDQESEAESKKVFYIGKFCMRNARTAHKFEHWKYHLKEWVVDYLKDKGELDPAKIIRRDGWNTSKRHRDAMRIVEEMNRVGEIKSLHKDFKGEISEAHYAQGYSGRDASSP